MVVVNSFGKSKKLIKHQEFLYVAGLTSLQWGVTEFFNFNPFFGQRSAPSPYWPPHTVIETRRFLNSSEESKRNTRLGDHSFLSATDWNAKLNWKI